MIVAVAGIALRAISLRISLKPAAPNLLTEPTVKKAGRLNLWGLVRVYKLVIGEV